MENEAARVGTGVSLINCSFLIMLKTNALSMLKFIIKLKFEVSNGAQLSFTTAPPVCGGAKAKSGNPGKRP